MKTNKLCRVVLWLTTPKAMTTGFWSMFTKVKFTVSVSFWWNFHLDLQKCSSKWSGYIFKFMFKRLISQIYHFSKFFCRQAIVLSAFTLVTALCKLGCATVTSYFIFSPEKCVELKLLFVLFCSWKRKGGFQVKGSSATGWKLVCYPTTLLRSERAFPRSFGS